MAQKRSQNNIGESSKTSVKVHHGPGGQSNWSLGWGEKDQTENMKTTQNTKYRNQSNIVLGETKEQEEAAQIRRQQQQKKKKQDQLNSKLPTYDPKKGGQSSIFFGDEKTDYSKKNQVFTSTKVRNPPGGKSNFQLG